MSDENRPLLFCTYMPMSYGEYMGLLCVKSIEISAVDSDVVTLRADLLIVLFDRLSRDRFRNGYHVGSCRDSAVSYLIAPGFTACR